jgi:hypothetical protein
LTVLAIVAMGVSSRSYTLLMARLHPGCEVMTVENHPRAGERVWRRDVALRRTRQAVAGVAVAAVGLSGFVSVVAARAFKGRPHGTPTPSPAPAQPARTPRVHVPAPDRIPSIAGDPAPLEPPAQPPAPTAAAPVPTAPPPAAPVPTVPPPQPSGGS